MSNSIIFSVCLIFLVLGCTPPETTSSTDSVPITDQGLIPADTFVVDTAFSVITWVASKPRVQHNGIFRLDSGVIGLTNGNIVSGMAYVNIPSVRIMDLDSAKDSYTKLYSHLLSNDFFDAQTYPQGLIQFKAIAPYDSTLVEKDQLGFIVDSPTHLLSTHLTLRGTTREIVIPVWMNVSDVRIEMEGKLIINRTHWDISYGDEATVIDKIKDQFIHNKVYLGFSLIARKPEKKAKDTDNLSL